MNLPQNVTLRYVNNLLRNGKNDEFSILIIEKKSMLTPKGVFIGDYFAISIISKDSNLVESEGATILSALTSALSEAGVTFR